MIGVMSGISGEGIQITNRPGDQFEPVVSNGSRYTRQRRNPDTAEVHSGESMVSLYDGSGKEPQEPRKGAQRPWNY